MTPKNWTLEGKNREEGWSKITQKSRKSFMDVPLGFAYLIYNANLRKQLKLVWQMNCYSKIRIFSY